MPESRSNHLQGHWPVTGIKYLGNVASRSSHPAPHRIPVQVRHRSGTSDRFKACGPITSLRSRFLPRNETAFQCQSVFFVKCIGVFNCGRKRVFSTKWCFGPVIVCQSLSEGLEPTIH